MKPGTLTCLVICKWIELIFLMLLTVFMIADCVRLTNRFDRSDFHLSVLSIIACIFAVFNLFYNNLLINIRFRVKTNCFTIGPFIYDIPNILFCHFCFHRLCRDVWCSIGSVIKWLVKSIYFIILITLIKNWKRTHSSIVEFSSLDADTYFDNLLIVYLL